MHAINFISNNSLLNNLTHSFFLLPFPQIQHILIFIIDYPHHEIILVLITYHFYQWSMILIFCIKRTHLLTVKSKFIRLSQSKFTTKFHLFRKISKRYNVTLSHLVSQWRKWYIWKFLLHLLVYPILSLLTLPRTYIYTVSTYLLSRKCRLVQTLNCGYSFGVVCQEVELLHIGERSKLLPSKSHGAEPKRIPSLGVEGRVRLVLLHTI